MAPFEARWPDVRGKLRNFINGIHRLRVMCLKFWALPGTQEGFVVRPDNEVPPTDLVDKVANGKLDRQ